jgi:hypothetical protein
LDFLDPEVFKTINIGKHSFVWSTRKLRVVFSWERRNSVSSESGVSRASSTKKSSSGGLRSRRKDNAPEYCGEEKDRVGTSDGGSTIVESREVNDGDKCEIMDRMKILGV